jgi:hypothetical protein
MSPEAQALPNRTVDSWSARSRSAAEVVITVPSTSSEEVQHTPQIAYFLTGNRHLAMSQTVNGRNGTVMSALYHF